MPGTVAGGRKAAATNKAKHGPDFYRKIGAIGGRNGDSGGFATYAACDCTVISGPHHKAQCAGVLGGQKSRRKPKSQKAA